MITLVHRLRREERGAFLVLFAVLSMVLVAMIALVLDLVALRVDERNDNSITDYAATAGAAMLDPLFGGTPHQGCLAAWRYFEANAATSGVSVPNPCGAFAPILRCDASTPATTVTQKVGDFTVTIKTPVPASDPAMEGRFVSVIDGEACQRIAVTVRKSRTYLWAGVMNQTSGNTTITSVARSSARTSQGETVAMIVLDPTGCQSLLASGQAQVLVKANSSLPGIIAVDSSGTESSSSVPIERRCVKPSDYAIDALGVQNSAIQSEATTSTNGTPINGVIYSYALMPGQGNGHSYDPTDVSTSRLRPQPIPGYRVTRSPVDNEYNCSVANACPYTDTRQAYIDQLRTAIGTNGDPASYGFEPHTGPCKTTPGMPPIIVPPGNWWVNCPNFDIANSVTFQSGNVVFQGNVTVGSTGSLTINDNASENAFVYFRDGSFTKDAQATITMRRTMVYLNNGFFSFGAGSGGLTWLAPTSGSFEDLALWSESTAAHDLGGQANLNIEGIFFTPNAYPFRFSGQGEQYQEKAQFIVYRLEVTGQGALIMQPDPSRSLEIPLLGVRLIR